MILPRTPVRRNAIPRVRALHQGLDDLLHHHVIRVVDEQIPSRAHPLSEHHLTKHVVAHHKRGRGWIHPRLKRTSGVRREQAVLAHALQLPVDSPRQTVAPVRPDDDSSRLVQHIAVADYLP